MKSNQTSRDNLKSYRERRAQTKNTNLSITSNNDLKEIQESILVRNRRMSLESPHNLLASLCYDTRSEFKDTIRQSECAEEEKIDESSIAKIMSYTDNMGYIQEVNEQELLVSGKLNPELQQCKIKTNTNVPSLKLSALQLKKIGGVTKSVTNKVQSKPIQPSVSVTSRKTVSQSSFKPSIIAKTDRKIPEKKTDNKTMKIDQTKFLKKLQLLQEQMGRLGFGKEKEAKWHFQNIFQLLKQ